MSRLRKGMGRVLNKSSANLVKITLVLQVYSLILASLNFSFKLSTASPKWTLQKLSLLSHSLHPQHTLLRTADGADEDDPTAGVATQELDAENNSPNVDALARLKSEFNLKEFLALATRVIDEGDTEAMTAISDLKNRWIAKFGGDFADAPPLRPVGHRPPTPFRHAIVPLRPAIRVPRLPSPDRMAAILSRGNKPSPTPLLTLPPHQPDSISPGPSAVIAPPPVRLELDAAGKETLPPRVSPPPQILAVAPPSMETNAAPSPLSRPIAVPTNEILIGKVPLQQSCSFDSLSDPIAHSFHNSSRKVLHYVPPTSQNGEVIVRPSLNMIHEGSKRWIHTAVGYFLGKKPYFYHVDEFGRSNWPGLKDVTATSSGFFFFRFNTEAAMTGLIEGGPWLCQGQPIVLQRWQPGMTLRKLKHTEVLSGLN
ncbi:UNVERIFIED_CONTAM: hypothetical protein Slati_3907800 [Sesamum latifolium]|uniref:DUF4283 domain-containing protein n=1 Tax=Sesamum latifolium TaxID=2727402 RepID=A0AAW2TMU3_9LAMI